MGKPSYASSEEQPSFSANKAFDGDINTRWSSSFSDSHSLWVDLGSIQKISKIVINWALYASQYQIQISNDGIQWATIFSDYKNPTGGAKTITFDQTNARYIKIYCIKRGVIKYGFSIWEFQVFDDTISEAELKSIAKAKEKVLNYLYSISGIKTLAGQHDKSPSIDPLLYNKQVFSITGKYPALYSSDFLFQDLDGRWNFIYEMERQWKKAP